MESFQLIYHPQSFKHSLSGLCRLLQLHTSKQDTNPSHLPLPWAFSSVKGPAHQPATQNRNVRVTLLLAFPCSPVCSPSASPGSLSSISLDATVPHLTTVGPSQLVSPPPLLLLKAPPEPRLWGQTLRVSTPALPPISCLSLGEFTHLSVAQNPHLRNGDYNSPPLILSDLWGTEELL